MQHGTLAKLRNFHSTSAIELQVRSDNDKKITAVNQTKLDHDASALNRRSTSTRVARASVK